MENNKENMIDSPDTAIMTRQWKKKLHKQITVFRQIMLDVGQLIELNTKYITDNTCMLAHESIARDEP